MLGYNVGVLIWPLLSQYLLSRFGYSYAMGIISTFSLVNIIAGILFVEPQINKSFGKCTSAILLSLIYNVCIYCQLQESFYEYN